MGGICDDGLRKSNHNKQLKNIGSLSERMIEIKQEKNDQVLAKKLGITYDELQLLDHEINTEESKDGIVYNYIIKFRNNSDRDILDKVIGVDAQNQVWFAPWELESDEYYEEQYEAIIANKDFLNKFQIEIENLEKLNEIEFEDKSLVIILKRQIFIGIISTLETFLSDAFINLTMNNDNYFRDFVESYPDFKERKFELRHLYIEQNRIKETGKQIMLDIIYHNLPKIKQMYSATFKIEFPCIESLMKHISTRHHLVHRTGKTKKGDEIIIDKIAVVELIEHVKIFVNDIAHKLRLDNDFQF